MAGAQNGAGPQLGPCKRLLAPRLNQRTSLSLKVVEKTWAVEGSQGLCVLPGTSQILERTFVFIIVHFNFLLFY